MGLDFLSDRDPGQGGARPWGVAQLVRAVQDSLQARFPTVTVEGELSSFSRATSGHCYFSLKDEEVAVMIRAAMFRRAAQMLQFQPGDGQRVEVRGRLALYEARGELQLIVESMRPVGQGQLLEQFLRLKAALEREGLFDPARKRELPAHPRGVAVVTSLGAAALRDVVTVLRRRSPHVPVWVFPCSVQGAQAAPEIMAALAQANAFDAVDVVLLCRGGGAMEDLWCFNDERLVRAVAASRKPVVSGVGHETDFTLCDFAADLRAATPSVGAELIAPDQQVLLAQLRQWEARFKRVAHDRLDREDYRLDQAAQRLRALSDRQQVRHLRLDRLEQRLAHVTQARLQAAGGLLALLAQRRQHGLAQALAVRQHQLASLAVRVGAVDPEQVLGRGYSWVTDESGSAIQDAAELLPGQALKVRMKGGRVLSRVESVQLDGASGRKPPRRRTRPA